MTLTQEARSFSASSPAKARSGHGWAWSYSSGEMAAAYAAGVLGAEDATCIAYYRGLHVGRMRQRGAMMAARVTAKDAEELVASHVFARPVAGHSKPFF